MSFLKKLGQVLATVATTAIGIGPIVSPLFGAKGDKVGGEIQTVANDFTLIAQQVAVIEVALQGKTGAEKFAALLPLVSGVIMTSQVVAGKKIADAALLQKGVNEVSQGMVDILNSLHQDSVSSEVKT